jgi:hypothetical protein
MHWIATVMLIAACAEPAHPIMKASPDTGGSNDCPVGMAPAKSSDLLIDYISLNWINLYPSYDSTKSYSGTPATCIQINGMGVQQTFEINNKAYGTLSISTPSVGNVDLNTFTGVLDVDLYGADVPVLFSNTIGFDSGSLYITAGQDSFEAEASIEAYTDSQQLSIHFFSAATTGL